MTNQNTKKENASGQCASTIGLGVVCDCCKREVEKVRGSVWHGDDLICLECFYEWYDPSGPSITYENAQSVERIGNYVRAKHGLPPMTPNAEITGSACGVRID